MANKMTVCGNYFYGNKISDYGIQNGYVDYSTLAKALEMVLNNDIIAKTDGIIGYWEQESGFTDYSEEIEELKEKIDLLENEEEIAELEAQIEEYEYMQDNYSSDIYQYYIVNSNGAKILKECGEIVFYNEELDMYVWGVTHWGTSWDYVLTDIKIEKIEK